MEFMTLTLEPNQSREGTLYPDDGLWGEALCPQLSQQLLQQLQSTLGQPGGDVGCEGLQQFCRNHLKASDFFQNSYFLNKEHEGSTPRHFTGRVICVEASHLLIKSNICCEALTNPSTQTSGNDASPDRNCERLAASDGGA